MQRLRKQHAEAVRPVDMEGPLTNLIVQGLELSCLIAGLIDRRLKYLELQSDCPGRNVREYITGSQRGHGFVIATPSYIYIYIYIYVYIYK
jgi:hypothetical protein